MTSLFDDYSRIDKENKNLLKIYYAIALGGIVFVFLSGLLVVTGKPDLGIAIFALAISYFAYAYQIKLERDSKLDSLMNKINFEILIAAVNEIKEKQNKF